MCGTAFNLSIIFFYSILDFLPGGFPAEEKALVMNCCCNPQSNSLEMPSQTETAQVLLEGFLQWGSLLWFGPQCFAASVSCCPVCVAWIWCIYSYQ